VALLAFAGVEDANALVASADAEYAAFVPCELVVATPAPAVSMQHHPVHAEDSVVQPDF
jgi:hypothetical protein